MNYDVMVTLMNAAPFHCIVESNDAIHAKLAGVRLAERAGIDPWAMTSASALPVSVVEHLRRTREAA